MLTHDAPPPPPPPPPPPQRLLFNFRLPFSKKTKRAKSVPENIHVKSGGKGLVTNSLADIVIYLHNKELVPKLCITKFIFFDRLAKFF